MLRKFIYGLALAGGVALGAFGSGGAAVAQSAPICDRFDTGALDGWGPCPWAPHIAVTTSTSGGESPSNPYLKLNDLAGASAACSANPNYLGDWNAKMGGCGQFCFDFKLFVEDQGSVTPSFTIWSGTVNHATFVANFAVTTNDPWRKNICAPVNLAASPPSNAQGYWVVSGGTWNSIITAVTMVQLPIDWTSDPNEEAGYDNLCMSPGGCGETPPPVIDGCLKDSKVAVTCNPDGTYTLTLSGSSFTGTTITLTSQTPGVTVTPPQQPWAATTTWTITGATPGETVILTANATNTGGGSVPGTDQCCSGQITIVMPNCPKQVGEVTVEKKVKNDTRASASVINSLVFPIGLSCTAPSNLNVSFGLNNGGTHTENNVPYTSVCTATESVSTLPAAPKDVCGEGSAAVWLTPVITPSSATINAPVTAFTVVNELKCVPVGSLSVTKVVDPDPDHLGSTQLFPMTVACTNSYPLIVHGNTSTVPFPVPVGEICTVTEGTRPSLPLGCTWLAPVYSPASVTIASGLNQETVTNGYRCEIMTGGSLVVTKEVVDDSPIPLPSEIYPVTVTCGGKVTNLNLVPGAPQTVSNIPPNASCSVVEATTPMMAANACPPRTTPTWTTAYVPASPINITGAGVAELVTNTFTCVPVRANVCPLPLVNVDGVCECSPGTVLRGRECVRPVVCRSPLVPNAADTACICPAGTVLRGKECVRPVVCRSPLVPNAADTACGCPAGTLLTGNECVRPVVCRPPMTPNGAGGCTCPRGMANVEGRCVPLERNFQRQIGPGIRFPFGPGGGAPSPGNGPIR